MHSGPAFADLALGRTGLCRLDLAVLNVLGCDQVLDLMELVAVNDDGVSAIRSAAPVDLMKRGNGEAPNPWKIYLTWFRAGAGASPSISAGTGLLEVK